MWRNESAAWRPVLLYHRVVPSLPASDPYRNCVTTRVFESHLKWLRDRGYRSVALSDISTSPRRSVAITFDDGYADNYTYAWPLLKRYGFRAAVHVVTDAIGSDNQFDTGHVTERVPMLTADQIRQLHQDGIEIGSHTCTHPDTLVDLSDRQLRDELERSRATLEGVLQAPVEQLAYPHSQVDRRVEAAAARAGYRLACAGVGTRFSPLCLNRVDPGALPGPGVEMRVRWRELKWRLKNSLDHSG